MSIVNNPVGTAIGPSPIWTTTAAAYPRAQPFTFTIQKAENGYLLTRTDNGSMDYYLAKDAEDLAQQVIAAMVAARLVE
jgi:hypothetical protein